MNDTLDRFSDYLAYELHTSPLTVEAYLNDCRQFATFLTGGDEESFDAASVTRNDIRSWIASPELASEAASTRRRKLLSIRALYHYLRRSGDVAVNPAADIPLPRIGKPLPAFVKESEIEAVTAESEFATDDFVEYRDALVVDLLYSTGMRCAELRELRDSDIDFGREELKVTGKGNKQRVLPLAPKQLDRIRRYMELRDAALKKSPQRLIVSQRGNPMNNSALTRIVKIRLASTSASKKSPHVLRHTFATTMLRHGADINSVKELLGHESLATTQIYTHLSLTELREAYSGAHPRSGGTRQHSDNDSDHKP